MLGRNKFRRCAVPCVDEKSFAKVLEDSIVAVSDLLDRIFDAYESGEAEWPEKIDSGLCELVGCLGDAMHWRRAAREDRDGYQFESCLVFSSSFGSSEVIG
jgi:hypothetical protein